MTECPYCGKDTGQVNNHIRMKNDDQHGDQGSYPEEWDRENRERTDAPDQGDDLDLGEQGDGDDQGGDDLPGEGGDLQLGEQGDDDELEEIDFGDTTAEAREYECGNCGEPLAYLGGDDREGGGKECPECGERIFWSMVE